MRALPSMSVASKARSFPSGEMRGTSIVAISAEGTMSKRTSGSGFGARRT